MWHGKSTHKTQNSRWLPLNHTLFVRQYTATKSRFAQKTRYQGALPICYFTSILKHWSNDFFRWSTPLHGCFLQTDTHYSYQNFVNRSHRAACIQQMQFTGLGVPNKYFATQNKQMYIRLHCLRALWSLSMRSPDLKIIWQLRPSVFKFNLKRTVIFLFRKFLHLQS